LRISFRPNRLAASASARRWFIVIGEPARLGANAFQYAVNQSACSQPPFERNAPGTSSAPAARTVCAPQVDEPQAIFEDIPTRWRRQQSSA